MEGWQFMFLLTSSIPFVFSLCHVPTACLFRLFDLHKLQDFINSFRLQGPVCFQQICALKHVCWILYSINRSCVLVLVKLFKWAWNVWQYLCSPAATTTLNARQCRWSSLTELVLRKLVWGAEQYIFIPDEYVWAAVMTSLWQAFVAISIWLKSPRPQMWWAD